MQLPEGLNRRYATFATFLLVTIWIWVAFNRPYTFPTHVPWNIYSNTPQSPPRALDIFEIPPVNSKRIRSVCDRTQWSPQNATVWFSCADVSGDVAEVRNQILSCLRYVVAVGGVLILPKIVLKEDWQDKGAGNATEMMYMFDMEHFWSSIQLSCPQLRILSTIEGLEHGDGHGPFTLAPESLVLDSGEQTVTDIGAWRGFFDTWLGRYILPDTTGPIFVNLGRSYLHYAVGQDGEEFIEDFGKLLNLPQDIRILATKAIVHLRAAFSFTEHYPHTIIPRLFLGVHLWSGPTGSLSAADVFSITYDVQSKLYFEKAEKSRLPVIYVASNDISEIARFSSDATALNISSTSKFDLLNGHDGEDLYRLNPTEQEMVDFLVLQKASQFGGLGHSALAWNVALKRHLLKDFPEYLNGSQVLEDELSVLYGTQGTHGDFARGMWP